jgi:predicted  nucleic acid-binding Zn-ribbon protein
LTGLDDATEYSPAENRDVRAPLEIGRWRCIPLDEYDQLRTDLEAARAEIERLRGQLRLRDNAGIQQEAELVQAQARIAAQERVVEAAKRLVKAEQTRLNHGRAIRDLVDLERQVRALDAADAAKEPAS